MTTLPVVAVVAAIIGQMVEVKAVCFFYAHLAIVKVCISKF